MKINIYKLTFPNNKIYIGQTTREYNVRIAEHKRSGNKNSLKKHHGYVYKAIRKYGWENIKHNLILICEDFDADYYEKELIKLYKSNNKNYGYNLESGGTKNKIHSTETKLKIGKAGKGRKITEETKLKISEGNRGKVVSEETKQKIREKRKLQVITEETKKKMSITRRRTPVDCFDKNGKFIRHYDSITEASENTGIHDGGIVHVCAGRKKSIHGFVWKYCIKN
jgi:group I intron endonuclease